MVKKILPFIFLALGLVLFCSGVFMSYEVKNDEKTAKKEISPPPQEFNETYTLENDRYEGEFSPQTEFRPLNEPDTALLLKEQAPTVNHLNEAGFAREFDLLDQTEQEKTSGTGIWPALMIFSGAFFLTLGFILFRKKLKES